MIAFGFGEIFGSFFIGFIIDRFGSRNAAWVNVGICSIMTALVVIYFSIGSYSPLAYFMMFMWGI